MEEQDGGGERPGQGCGLSREGLEGFAAAAIVRWFAAMVVGGAMGMIGMSVCDGMFMRCLGPHARGAKRHGDQPSYGCGQKHGATQWFGRRG